MSFGVLTVASRGEIVHNTILDNKANIPEYARSLSSWGAPGAGILVGQDANISVYSNIIGGNSVGIFIATAQGWKNTCRIEYNDVYDNVAEGDYENWNGNFSNKIMSSDWNYTKGVKTEVDENPVISFSTWSHTKYYPNPPAVASTNVSTDPFFVDPARGDYRLAADSPLIGRGRSGSHIGAYPPATQKAGEGEFK
jgi:hypothetical protein